MITILFLALVAFYLYRLLGGAPPLRLHRRRPPIHQMAAAKIEELSDYAGRLRASNKFNNAEKIYLQILKIDHRHAATYLNLGTLYMVMKNLPSAIECLEIASQLSPDDTTFYHLGVAYYENRNPMKAIAALEKSIMFEPAAKTYYALAKAFNRMGDGPHMIEALERAAELEATPRILWLLHDACLAAERPEQAAEALERIRQLDPKDARLRQMRASGRAAAATRPRTTA